MTACVFDESAIFNKRKKVERMQQNSVEASRCLGRNSNDATCLSSFKWAMTYQRRRLPSSLTNTTLHNIRKLWCFTYTFYAHTSLRNKRQMGIAHHKVAPCFTALVRRWQLRVPGLDKQLVRKPWGHAALSQNVGFGVAREKDRRDASACIASHFRKIQNTVPQ